MKVLTSVRRYAVLAGVLAPLSLGPAWAQYTYDPSNADEQIIDGLRYFGSVKDASGALVPGASIMIDSPKASFVFVTNDQGRFRGVLPLSMAGVQTELRCSKPGYQVVRINKRPGPKSQHPTMQVDCVLRPAQAAAAQ